MSSPQSPQRHPLESLAILVGLILAGGIFSTLLALWAGKLIYPDSNLQDALLGTDAASLGYLKIIQIFSTIGTFIIPGFLFAWIESGSAPSYLKLNKFPVVLGVMAIFILFVSYPILEYTVVLNEKMKLPGFLQGVEEWMRNKETQMAELTRQLLGVATPGGLAVNLLMIAILPAIGEEFIFRGCLQNIIWRWAKNYHIAIWAAAFIFSAIHFQFYGFLPRMLLGAMLGYLLVWGRSIWLPILVHFANNAASVITAYSYQLKGKSLDKLDEQLTDNMLIYLLSLVLTGVLIWRFYRISQTQNISEDFIETDGEQLG